MTDRDNAVPDSDTFGFTQVDRGQGSGYSFQFEQGQIQRRGVGHHFGPNHAGEIGFRVSSYPRRL